LPSRATAERLSIVCVDEAAKACLRTEVEKQTNFDGTGTQVVEKLRFMSGLDGVRDLDLDEHAVSYE
jgi:hypothetical protein